MNTLIPQAAPQRRIRRFKAAIAAATERVLDGDAYILGPEVAQFEQLFATYLDVRHCIGVNSGTDALTIAIRALDLPDDAEVLTVAMTASATGSAIVLAGAQPRFVDVDPATRCIDIDRLAEAVTPRTAAVVPVHLHGYPVDMPRLMAIAERLGLQVVEDCAQAHGARIGERPVGGFGHAAAFSFYPTKNLGGTGDGGAIVTNDPDLAQRARALRIYGWRAQRGTSDFVGYNSRLAEIQAATLSALLPHLDDGNRERRRIAETYREGFADHARAGRMTLPPGAEGAVYHQFAIAADDRDVLRQRLLASGLGTAVHYAVPLHRQPAFARHATAALPETDRLANRMVSLPVQPEVADGAIDDIIERVGRAIGS